MLGRLDSPDLTPTLARALASTLTLTLTLTLTRFSDDANFSAALKAAMTLKQALPLATLPLATPNQPEGARAVHAWLALLALPFTVGDRTSQ